MSGSQSRPPGEGARHRDAKGRERPTGRAAYRPRTDPDPARRAALDVLRAVSERDSYANLVLPGLLRERRLNSRDAAFATELAYGALRGQGTYDAVLAACSDRPLAELDPAVLDALRLGVHQLLGMRVPAHAAVSATVDLVRSASSQGAARFANAVLRRVSEHDVDAWLARVAPDRGVDPLGHLAVTRSHPLWIVRALRDALLLHGRDADELDALLAADNERPEVVLAALPGLASVEELLLGDASPGRWSPVAVRLSGGDPGALAAVREGRARVQDEGSQLVALALAAGGGGETGERWLDLCAGPGGKAALLTALAVPRGATLDAVEVSEHRAALVRQALRPVDGSTWTVRQEDGREVGASEPGRYDRVLVDAPCTGLGALRRRPEARWRRTAQDLATLGPLQRALLGSALDAVRPGGSVLYATCSPHPAETRFVVEDVLRRRDDARRVDVRPLLPGVPDLGEGPAVQLWPHLHSTDAMHLALLRRHE